MRQELWIIGDVGRPDQIPCHASGTRFENDATMKTQSRCCLIPQSNRMRPEGKTKSSTKLLLPLCRAEDLRLLQTSQSKGSSGFTVCLSLLFLVIPVCEQEEKKNTRLENAQVYTVLCCFPAAHQSELDSPLYKRVRVRLSGGREHEITGVT